MGVPSPDTIKAQLDEILASVQKPTRYLGLERNLVRKPWESAAIRVALAFPDAYEIGMSHQGTRILYHLVNRRSDALAERSFAPMPDMAAALREAGLPLYTLESYRPIRSFHIVGISLQSELNYINVPYVLDLAGITRRAVDRDEEEPIVLGGGPCTANPEPVADFFDAILIGDGEAALDSILDTIRDLRTSGTPRAEILTGLSRIPGIYVPSLYRWTAAGDSHDAQWDLVDDSAPFPVPRVWVDELDPDDQPHSVIVPFAEVIQDRLGMEIMRGCTQGCRFCQAGYWYRPVREHDPKVVADRIERQVAETGFEQVGLLSLSSADYSQVEPLVEDLASRLQDQRVSISLPSLRADAFSVGLAEAVSKVRKSGFTFAPETGSDRLRRVINKTFTNADMITAAEAAYSKGWQMIKVYAMIGLPTETDDDLEELARLAEDIVAAGRRATGGRKVQVKVSVGCFVPKAWTPFQWQAFAGVAELGRRIDLLKKRFKRIRGARLSWAEPEESALEALLSRGDRRMSAAIERAHDLGSVFDGWSDLLDLDAWKQALDEASIDVNRELGERELTATLPWDCLDAGVRKGFLKAELRRSLREVATDDCKWGHCYRCGIPGEGSDVRLAGSRPPAAGNEPSHELADGAAVSQRRSVPHIAPQPTDRGQPSVHRRYRFTFAKRGDARWLSHRQVMDTLERVLRAAGLPVHYTQGFNPHIRLSMGPALAVGMEGEAEPFDVDCTAPINQSHLERANSLLPDGLAIVDATALLPGAPSIGRLVDRARFRVQPRRNGTPWPTSIQHLDPDLKQAVRGWRVAGDGSLHVELNARQESGPTPSLKKVLVAIGLDDREAASARAVRERLVLKPRRATQTSHSDSQKASAR